MLLLATSMILIPYFWSAAYGLLLTLKGETYENDARERSKDLVIAGIAVAYACLLYTSIEDALSMVASRRRAMNVELLRDVPDAPLWVQAGETRLRQILGNLLTNALDALAEKAPPRRLWVCLLYTSRCV